MEAEENFQENEAERLQELPKETEEVKQTVLNLQGGVM